MIKILQNKIELMCDNILSKGTQFYDDPNGPYYANCPFCEVTKSFKGSDKEPGMGDLKHDDDCAWVLAKDIADLVNGNYEKFV